MVSDITALRWKLHGPRGPSRSQTLLLAEASRAAIIASGSRQGLARWPDSFHGPASGGAHDHAHWLPADRDGDGWIDHLLLFAPSGIPLELLPLLCGCHRVFFERGLEWELRPVWMGIPPPDGIFSTALVWRTVTPYVTPRRVRRAAGGERAALSPEGQMRWELQQRGWPMPTKVKCLPDQPHEDLASSFVVTTRTRRAPPYAVRSFAEVVFPHAVRGPLTLGFGAHFGLGLFAPQRPLTKELQLAPRHTV